MGFFNWAAPVFKYWGERWSEDDVARISSRLRLFVEAEGRLLDLGGGTGGLAGRLADALGARVTLLDPAPEMLRYAPERGEVDVVEGSAEEIPFDDDTFDAVVVSDALHHFRDQERAAAEIARVTRPGGGVLVLEMDRTNLGTRISAVFERALREPAGFLSPGELEDLMRSQGIEGTSTIDGGPYYSFLGRVAGGPSAVTPSTDSRRPAPSRDDD